MKHLFMKSAMLAVAALCQMGTATLIGSNTQSLGNGGNIVVEGNNLISSSDSPGDIISEIQLLKIEGGIIYLDGCERASCVTEIPKDLPCGNYHVEVISRNGGFNGDVYICI